MKALIFDIKRFAIHDGPGIRSTVFFKGCPLACPWCHNPESRDPTPVDYEQINYVGNRKFCSTKTIGKYYGLDELFAEVNKDKPFYEQSGGGITCSGGEPLEQSLFLLEFLKICKKQELHTAIDTSGYAPWANIRDLLPFTDLFLFDIKHLDDTCHKKYTGVSNEIILENLKRLINSGVKIYLRIPLISGINMDGAYIRNLRDFIAPCRADNFHRIQLLPYHLTGKSKYKKFKVNGFRQFERSTTDEINNIRKILAESNFNVTIGG